MVSIENITYEKKEGQSRELRFVNYLEKMFDGFEVDYTRGMYMSIGDGSPGDKINFDILHNTFTVHDSKYERVAVRLANIYETEFNLKKDSGVKLEFDYSESIL